MRNGGSKICQVLFVLLLLCGLSGKTAICIANTADDEKKKQEIIEKIKKLTDKKRIIDSIANYNVSGAKEKGKSIDDIIASYEKLLDGCSKKSDRCADVLFTLARYYYDQEKDAYIKARDDYGALMDTWEKTQKGPEPVNPRPDYSKAMSMYLRLTKEYNDYKNADEAYYQMGNVYTLLGDVDSSKWAYNEVLKVAPNGYRASGAHFRLADFANMDRDYPRALKHYELCKPQGLTPENLGMIQFRKGEISYNMGDFEKAVEYFFEYIQKCDAGEFPNQELRQEVLEYMAIAFSDMQKGSEEALSFFKKVGGRPYEDYVLYTIGMKNRVHGQTDDAIAALQVALKKYPYYKDAPIAQQMLVECFIIKKDYEKANAAREKLVDFYGIGGEWYSKNTTQKAVIDQASNEVRKALAAIPLYYHGLAQKSKDKTLYEKALKRYNEFAQKFPNDKWHNYEFRYYMAEIYNTLGDFQKSAENFDFVAMADIASFGQYQEEYDTLGMDATEQEKHKKESKSGPISISQEDAAYNAIVALMNARKKSMARDAVSDDKTFDMPETKQLLEYVHKYQTKFSKSVNAAEISYIGADLYYAAKMYDNAIKDYKFIIDTYPESKFAQKAMRMIATCYVNTGEFELASAKYRELLKKTDPATQEFNEISELAAAAVYKKAEAMKKANNALGAAEAFKSIAADFPKSKVAVRGWFESAVCYELVNNMEMAASILQELPVKYPNSDMRENAFLRAADDFKKIAMWKNAATVYLTAALTITKTDYAIPSLSFAAEAYQKINDYDNAGKMYEVIFEKYPKDTKTPQALYNAGLIYEKGKLYDRAIRVYTLLTQNFPASEYSPEAFFSIGLCYEKMGRNADMANVFTEFAKKYDSDKYKQVEALVKAGDAYYNLGDQKEAEKDYQLAVEVYEKFKGKADMNVEALAKAYFMQGEILYKTFSEISLQGSVKQVKENLKEKQDALKTASEPYQKAIELGVEEWTLRSTFKIGMSFIDFAEAIENQSIEGSVDQKLGAKIKILSSLDQYYLASLKYFQQNIDWAYDQNIKSEYINKSMDMFMKILFMRANALEKVGIILKESPVPKDLSKEDKQAYKEVLEEKSLEAMDKALPLYEGAIDGAIQMGITQSPWIDKIRERIKDISPASEALNKPIPPRAPKVVAASPTVANANGVTSGKTPEGSVQKTAQPQFRDEQYTRNMKRIQNIMQMDIPLDDKVKQLKHIELDAQRSIAEEEEKIEDLKKKSGSK